MRPLLDLSKIHSLEDLGEIHLYLDDRHKGWVRYLKSPVFESDLRRVAFLHHALDWHMGELFVNMELFHG